MLLRRLMLPSPLPSFLFDCCFSSFAVAVFAVFQSLLLWVVAVLPMLLTLPLLSLPLLLPSSQMLLLTVVIAIATISSRQLLAASFPIIFYFLLQSLQPCQGCSHCLLSPSLLMLLAVLQCCQRQLQLAVIIVSCQLIVTACLMVLLQPVIAVLPMLLLLVLYLSDLHGGPCLATNRVYNWG